MKNIYLYLQNTMADWEAGYFLQGLTLQESIGLTNYKLVTVANSLNPIITSAGLKIVPDKTIEDINLNQAAALLLIGGDTWGKEGNTPILNIAEKLLTKHIVVGAICGATLGLANKGMLDTVPHTSNAPFYLTTFSKQYKGQINYENVPAVSSDCLVTASSAGSLLWAKYLLAKLSIIPQDILEEWYQYFLTGNVQNYMNMMEGIQKLNEQKN